MIRLRSSYIVGAIASFIVPAAALGAFVGPSDAPPNGNVPGVVWNRSTLGGGSNQQLATDFNIAGSGRLGGDILLGDTKALRVDKPGDAVFYIGNWGSGSQPLTVKMYGDLTVSPAGIGEPGQNEGKINAQKYCFGVSCITSWPSSGMSTATADGRYVNVTGDTMTGGLTVTPGSGTAGTFNGQTWGVRGFGDTSGGFFRNEINTSYSGNIGMNGYGGFFNAPSNELSLYSTQNTQIAGKLGIGKNPSTSGAKLQIAGTTDPLLTISAGFNVNPAMHFQINNTSYWYLWMNYAAGDFNIGSPSVNPALTIKDSNGRVGIGTTLPDQRLTVNGAASKPGGGSWSTFSDERLKRIDGGYARGLVDLLKLEPVLYEYLDQNALGVPNDGTHVGFSAQAVQKVIPEAVSTGESGYLYLNNDPILWTMLNSIKELKAENDALKARLDRLEKKR